MKKYIVMLSIIPLVLWNNINSMQVPYQQTVVQGQENNIQKLNEKVNELEQRQNETEEHLKDITNVLQEIKADNVKIRSNQRKIESEKLADDTYNALIKAKTPEDRNKIIKENPQILKAMENPSNIQQYINGEIPFPPNLKNELTNQFANQLEHENRKSDLNDYLIRELQNAKSPEGKIEVIRKYPQLQKVPGLIDSIKRNENIDPEYVKQFLMEQKHTKNNDAYDTGAADLFSEINQDQYNNSRNSNVPYNNLVGNVAKGLANTDNSNQNNIYGNNTENIDTIVNQLQNTNDPTVINEISKKYPQIKPIIDNNIQNNEPIDINAVKQVLSKDSTNTKMPLETSSDILPHNRLQLQSVNDSGIKISPLNQSNLPNLQNISQNDINNTKQHIPGMDNKQDAYNKFVGNATNENYINDLVNNNNISNLENNNDQEILDRPQNITNFQEIEQLANKNPNTVQDYNKQKYPNEPSKIDEIRDNLSKMSLNPFPKDDSIINTQNKNNVNNKVQQIINELKSTNDKNKRKELLEKYKNELKFLSNNEQNLYINSGRITNNFEQKLMNNIVSQMPDISQQLVQKRKNVMLPVQYNEQEGLMNQNLLDDSVGNINTPQQILNPNANELAKSQKELIQCQNNCKALQNNIEKLQNENRSLRQSLSVSQNNPQNLNIMNNLNKSQFDVEKQGQEQYNILDANKSTIIDNNQLEQLNNDVNLQSSLDAYDNNMENLQISQNTNVNNNDSLVNYKSNNDIPGLNNNIEIQNNTSINSQMPNTELIQNNTTIQYPEKNIFNSKFVPQDKNFMSAKLNSIPQYNKTEDSQMLQNSYVADNNLDANPYSPNQLQMISNEKPINGRYNDSINSITNNEHSINQSYNNIQPTISNNIPNNNITNIKQSIFGLESAPQNKNFISAELNPIPKYDQFDSYLIKENLPVENNTFTPPVTNNDQLINQNNNKIQLVTRNEQPTNQINNETPPVTSDDQLINYNNQSLINNTGYIMPNNNSNNDVLNSSINSQMSDTQHTYENKNPTVSQNINDSILNDNTNQIDNNPVINSQLLNNSVQFDTNTKQLDNNQFINSQSLNDSMQFDTNTKQLEINPQININNEQQTKEVSLSQNQLQSKFQLLPDEELKLNSSVPVQQISTQGQKPITEINNNQEQLNTSGLQLFTQDNDDSGKQNNLQQSQNDMFFGNNLNDSQINLNQPINNIQDINNNIKQNGYYPESYNDVDLTYLQSMNSENNINNNFQNDSIMQQENIKSEEFNPFTNNNLKQENDTGQQYTQNKNINNLGNHQSNNKLEVPQEDLEQKYQEYNNKVTGDDINMMSESAENFKNNKDIENNINSSIYQSNNLENQNNIINQIPGNNIQNNLNNNLQTFSQNNDQPIMFDTYDDNLQLNNNIRQPIGAEQDYYNYPNNGYNTGLQSQYNNYYSNQYNYQDQNDWKKNNEKFFFGRQSSNNFPLVGKNSNSQWDKHNEQFMEFNHPQQKAGNNLFNMMNNNENMSPNQMDPNNSFNYDDINENNNQDYLSQSNMSIDSNTDNTGNSDQLNSNNSFDYGYIDKNNDGMNNLKQSIENIEGITNSIGKSYYNIRN